VEDASGALIRDGAQFFEVLDKQPNVQTEFQFKKAKITETLTVTTVIEEKVTCLLASVSRSTITRLKLSRAASNRASTPDSVTL